MDDRFDPENGVFRKASGKIVDHPQAEEWDGTPIEEWFFRAISKGYSHHPAVERMKKWAPEAYERARKRAEG